MVKLKFWWRRRVVRAAVFGVRLDQLKKDLNLLVAGLAILQGQEGSAKRTDLLTSHLLEGERPSTPST